MLCGKRDRRFNACSYDKEWTKIGKLIMEMRKGRIVNYKFLRIGICFLFVCFIIRYFNSNVLSEIGESKIYGAMDVPELEGCLSGWRDEWEWMCALDGMGASSIDYKEEFLRKDVALISLSFFNGVYHNNNDVGINVMVNLSESDKVKMKVGMHYYCEEKELVYDPIYILQGESGCAEKYTDEKSIDEYLNRYGLTRKDVQEYQEYAVYDVVVKTWAKAHHESYFLERWKLKRCKVIDNTFQFEEE